MKPVEQTIFRPEEGANCYAACVASLLEIPLVDVPHLHGAEGMTEKGYDGYRERLYRWLRARNLEPLYFKAQHDWIPSGYAIMAVRSPRCPEIEHAVVARDGVVVWDPHPQRERWAEIGQETVGYTIFQAIDPAKAMS